MDKLLEAMAAIGAANKDVGVAQRGGKKYTMVQDRVLAWRQAFGLDHGVESEISKDDGELVQVRCIIRDNDGHAIGSGLAEEVRGSSNVNKTSALENCETSALGRALASMGLHGGEFASINEIEKAEGIAKRITEQPPAKPPVPHVKPPPIVADEIPFTEEDERTDWVAWVEEQIAGFAKHRTTAEHTQWSSTVKEHRQRCKVENLAHHERLLNAYTKRKNELENRST